MDEKWHFYCDEAGAFEKIETYHNYQNSIIAGILVPDSSRKALSEQYTGLLKKHGITSRFVHGKDLFKDPAYNAFVNDLVDLTVNAPIKLCRTAFKRDMFSLFPEKAISETFAGNRYLYMMESLLEHIIFLDPENFGNNQSFFLHPNSRVFPCTRKEKDHYEAYGFDVFCPDKTQPDHCLVNVWSETGLRIFINRLCVDYEPFVTLQGRKSISEIEMPVAKKSNDNFVHWVDNLAGVLMWATDDTKTRLASSLYMDIQYGEATDLYRQLCRLYLQKAFDRFVDLYFQSADIINSSCYSNKLEMLLAQSLEKFNLSSVKQAYKLEKIVDHHLRSGTGELQYSIAVVDYLIKAVTRFEFNEKRLLIKLYNHKLSCLNHRGEVIEAWKVVEKTRETGGRANTIEDWRQEAEFINRKAVTSANVFEFLSCNSELERILETLTQTRALMNHLNDMVLKDPLIGKISGTMAQNYAFSAPFIGGCFEKAETIFLRARDEFENPPDILRQNIYLAHLYMDWGKSDKVKDTVNKIASNDSVKKFINDPCADNARYMGFPLAVFLKFFLYNGETGRDFLDQFTRNNIKTWFKNAGNEHPFEFIFAYLGRLSFQNNKIKRAQGYFNSALSIPRQGKTSLQITIRMIHTQILVWWALEYFAHGNDSDAVEKLTLAVNILTRIGEDDQFSPVLKIENKKGVSGWFAQGYNTLVTAMTGSIEKSAEEKQSCIDACHSFLKFFTFNYR